MLHPEGEGGGCVLGGLDPDGEGGWTLRGGGGGLDPEGGLSPVLRCLALLYLGGGF